MTEGSDGASDKEQDTDIVMRLQSDSHLITISHNQKERKDLSL